MDKKSNRTDLLAAGRKRLDQYRQKSTKGKDGKGKHGRGGSSKSSKRGDRSEQHDEEDNVGLTSAGSSHLPDKDPLLLDSDSSASVSVKNPEDSTLGEPIEGAISIPLLDDKVVSEGAVDLSGEGSEEVQSLPESLKESEKLVVDPVEDERTMAVGIPMSEAANADSYISATSSAPPIEFEVLKNEDQVSSDVGAMQEAHDSGSKDGDNNIQLVEQEDINSSAYLVDDRDAAPNKLTVWEQENNTRAGEYDAPSIVAVEETDTEEASVSFASDSDGRAVSLLKLVDLTNGLSDDDFRFLINSRTPVNGNTLSVQTEHSDVSGALREHLYFANISKDFFHLQLLEASKHEIEWDHTHKKLADEISLLSSSLADVSQRNELLYAELTDLRSELTAAIYEKEEIRNQYDSADAEIKELHAKVDELNLVIEESSKSFFILSEELDSCKHQLTDSLAENAVLVNTLASTTEEKNREMELKEQLFDEKLSRELAGCMSAISALEVEIASLNINLSFITDEKMKVEEEKQFLSANNEKIFVDFEDSKRLMDALEKENSKFNASLAELSEERRMIEDSKDSLVDENKRLSHELALYQERLSTEHAQFEKLEDGLEKARLHHEQLMEENICLSNTLELYKGKIVEISDRHLSSSSQGVVGADNRDHASVPSADELQNISTESVIEDLSSGTSKLASDNLEKRLPVNRSKGEIYDDVSGFVILKGHLEEAELLLQDLEKAMELMYSHSMTFSPSIGRNAAPGISKLMQAFEPKDHADENELETSHITGDDLHTSQPKHHTGSLRDLLKAMCQDIVLASNFVRFEKEGRESASASLTKLVVDVESWKDYCASMESHNIELEIQYEVMKQHLCSMEAHQTELKASCETLSEQENSLRTQNIQLAEKMMNYHSRIAELFDQLNVVRKSSREIASNVHSELDDLKKDVMENISKVEGAMISSFSMASQVVEKLDAAMGSTVLPPSPSNSAYGAGCVSQILISVDAACQMIEDLKARLEAASIENATLSASSNKVSEKFDALIGENRSAVELLHKISADLINCLDGYLDHENESETQPDESSLKDALKADHFETIIKQLSNLLSERLQVKELNKNLHSELSNKTNNVEVLKQGAFDSDPLLNLVENAMAVLKLQPTEFDSNESSFSRLQSLLSLLIGKYKDADDHTRLFKDDINSKLAELSEQQEYTESVNSCNFQQQTEILVLKESLKQANYAFDATRDKLHLKVTELEHCEQRLASIREKLSIAVAKGKGLIVQRDSLKQSLAETSIELERCSQDLQLKEATLQEVEHKLKAYSEAGERVEALESELSYIRNSATALRESFLLKDSTLQRIEEILEDLELPEHFHSRDIIEKVDYLAKTIATSSLLAADWEQRSSIGGGSFSDTGGVTTDSWKDDAQPSMNMVDDWRRQYDELQKRFFALAEQNEMLEQSLIERNNLVQRWEGVLDRIDTPIQIRAMEPDERIQWLGTALSEADNHMSSLQQKVDNLEGYCGSIVADLEESQKQASELVFSLQTVTRERSDLEQSLVERNNLVQRLEEVLDRMDTPLPLRSMQLEERIQWLGAALGEANELMKSLQKKVESLEINCGSLTANLEESQTLIPELQISLEAVKLENEALCANLVALRSVHDISLEKTVQFKQTADDLKGEVDALTANLKESQTLVSELQISLQAVNRENEALSANLVALRADHSMSLEKTVQFKQTADDLRSEADALTAKLEESKALVSELQISLQAVNRENEALSANFVALRSEHEKSLEKTVQFKQAADDLSGEVEVLTANLEESQTLVSELQISLQAVNHENEALSANLVALRSDHGISLEKVVQFKQTADDLRSEVDALTANLEESQALVSELRISLEAVNRENEALSANLVALRSDHGISLEKTVQFKQTADDLRSEVDALQEKLAEKLEAEKYILQVDDQMLRWRDLIIETLQSCGTESLVPDGRNSGESLETLIQRLVDEFMRFGTEIQESKETVDHTFQDTTVLDERNVVSAVDEDVHECSNPNPPECSARDTLDEEVQRTTDLRRELDDAMNGLAYLREERDEYMKKSHSLVNELEELKKKKEELQKQLNQEEQKSATLREKLNVAVKKGKSLVQHRDALKQNIEGFNAEIDSLKSDLKMRDGSISVFEQKIRDLSSQIESNHVLESENLSLSNHLMEIKQHLHDREHTLSLLLGKLDEINIGSELEVRNPLQKLEGIQKSYSNLHGSVVASEQEAKKSKRAAELLLAELNEVQERNDNLQEDLSKAHKEILELSRQNDIAESAKLQVISRMQELSEETTHQRAEYDLLKPYLHKLEREFSDISVLIADGFAKDMDLLHRLRVNLESCITAMRSDIQLPMVSGILMSWISDGKKYLAPYSIRGTEVQDQSDNIGAHLTQLARETEHFKEQIHIDSMSLHDEAELLLKCMANLQNEAISLKRSFDSISSEYLHLESTGKKRDMECTIMQQCILSLYEVCCSSILEIENRRAQVVGNGFSDEHLDSKLKALSLGDGGLNFSELDVLTSTERAKMLGDRLLLAVRESVNMHDKSLESGHKEMRATISSLQKDLQEKDVQKEQMCMELVSQIKEAEATAKAYSRDLQSAKVQVHDVEKRLQLAEEERKLLENRIATMQQEEVASSELQEKVTSLTSLLAAKEHEIDALMQALEEEENQMEGLKTRVEELEMVVKRKTQDFEQAVTARAKALKKLSITVSKFDELHHMSESLLSEVENLQTQLQDRESEISFLRQEVTRCTNDALVASKTAKERNSNELQDLLAWLETTVARVIEQELHSGDNNNQNIVQKDRLQNSITSIVTELEELRISAQRKDALLQAERNELEELLREKDALEASLHEKESHLSSLLSARESGESISEIVEVQSVINKWVAPVPSTASQVRSLRKSNNEQVAIAIDSDTSDTKRLEDEDDDKVHGFKSLTTSRFVPKFTRRVSDTIDGLWVSCDRALMRQPGLRLGIMIYWAILHTLIATFVV